MPTTNYATMNGELIGETGPNGPVYYHTDALGSVTMTTDENSNVLNEYRYAPYGTQISMNVRNLFITIGFVPASTCPLSDATIQPLKLFQQITYDPATGEAASSGIKEFWPAGYLPATCQIPPKNWP